MHRIQVLIFFPALLAWSISVHAHHSYAMFDTNQVVTTTGVLRTVEWTNPHVWLWVDVENEKGTVTYGFESLSPGQLMRDYSWDKRLLKIGEKVTVEYAPLKSGQPGGALVKIVFSDGRALLTRFSVPRETPLEPATSNK
jgi:hypothetical protein